MKSKLLRTLGVSAALLLPAGGVAMFTASTAGANDSHVKASFSFSKTGGVHGKATCATHAFDNTIPCTTSGSTGAGTGSIKTLTKVTFSGTSVSLTDAVSFKVSTGTPPTYCTINLGAAVHLTLTTTTRSTTYGEYVGTATVNVPPATVSPTTATCRGLLTAITGGTFHVSISPSN